MAKHRVLYYPYYGADPQIRGAGLTKERADEYVKEQRQASMGAFVVEEEKEPAKAKK